MSQKTEISTLTNHLNKIFTAYLELSELVLEFQNLKNRGNLASGKYVFNRDLESKVKAYQQHLAKMSYLGIQIEKELLDIQNS